MDDDYEDLEWEVDENGDLHLVADGEALVTIEISAAQKVDLAVLLLQVASREASSSLC